MKAGLVYNSLTEGKQQGHKKIAALIDPDKVTQKKVERMIRHAVNAAVDYFFVGGSLVMDNSLSRWIQLIKSSCDIPVIIFPGSPLQINGEADAIFFLSLISGRNPELLIGHHVVSAPILHQMDIEVMSTAYMLIDGGAPTTVSYISNTHPIPANKSSIAVATALAGQMLGMKIIYLDSGSGAIQPVSEKMIRAVSSQIDVPLIVGGGIRTPELARNSCLAGADLIVVGNALETDPSLVEEMAASVHAVGCEVSGVRG